MCDSFVALKEWVSLIKDVILTTASIIAGYVGLKGLGTWRRQLTGNTEYELAKKVLRSVYELREAITSVRHPFMQYPRAPDMPEEELKKLSQREAEWRAMAQAYQKRWEVIPKAKSALDTALLEAEVVWGRKIEKAECFNQLIGELLVAIEDHIEAMNPNVLHEQQNPEEIKKRREIMYARGLADKDEFRKRLEAIISDVEEELKPHIKRYHR